MVVVSDQTVATLVGLGVFVALRLLDYLLPKGRHFRFVDRFSRPDGSSPGPEDEEG